MQAKKIKLRAIISKFEIDRFFIKILAFPVITTILLLVLTITGINGSSLGVYDDYLYNEESSNTIYSQPRGARSDEWLVNTPHALAQEMSGFSIFNENVAGGQNMALGLDAPYKNNWSAVFKPQNFMLFILPFEMGFAFKWWFLSWILVNSVYLLGLIITRKILISILLSVSFLFSPFIQWWYQSITILPIAYSILIALLAYRVFCINHNSSNNRKFKLALHLFLISYFIICFSLVLYPAFQIPCAVISLMLFICLVKSRFKYKFKDIIYNKSFRLLLIALAISLAFIGLFIFDNKNEITLISETVYPGERSVASGGYDVDKILYWPINYVLKSDENAFAFRSNQSEASSFLLFGLLTIPFLIWMFFFKEKEKYNLQRNLLFGCLIILGVFAIRAFVPFGSFLFNVLGLSSVPHERLLIAVGVLNLILIMIVSTIGKSYKIKEITLPKLLYVPSVLYMFITIAVFYLSLTYISREYSIQGLGMKNIALISLVCSLIISLIIHRINQMKYIGIFILLAFSLYSGFRVNPLYKETGTIKNSRLSESIQNISAVDDSFWITEGDMRVSAMPLANGAKSLSGVHLYPKLDIWSELFPNENTIYNRYAHVQFDIDDNVYNPIIKLTSNDAFKVTLSSCSPFLNKLKVNYILSTDENISYKCFNIYKQPYTNRDIYILKRAVQF